MKKIASNFRKIALFKLVGVLIMFMLPFVNVSCQGLEAQTFTGMDLVWGTSLSDSSPAMTLQNALPSSGVIAAMLALVCAIAALTAALMVKGWLHVVSVSVLSLMGVLSLLWLQLAINADVLQRGQGALGLQWQAGYWMALSLFSSVTILGAICAARRLDVFYGHKAGATLSDVPPAASWK